MYPLTVLRILPLAALACLLVACSGSAGAPTEDALVQHVRAAPVREAAPESVLSAVGVLAPRDELRLAFKVGGVIERIDVDVGDRVQRGERLASLLQTEIAAAVQRAAQWRDKAQRDLDRARALYSEDVTTLEQVQDLETALGMANADLETARFNARHARIEAPADGVVLRRLGEPGELVQAGAPVLMLGSASGGWVVRVALADRDFLRIALGDRARVRFDALGGEPLDARVQRLASASDAATGTYEVELALDANARFVQGLVAHVQLEPSSAAGLRLWAPVAALLEAQGERATVFVLTTDARRVEQREVRIGELRGEEVEVRSGLAAGERVVTEGAAWLEDGGAVDVLAQTE